MSNKTQVFTPEGGMNQDDSILTPTPNTAGRNAFGLGDYRYALNARIGSSRSDNFGDVENLKGTLEKTQYAVFENLFDNPDFLSSLAGWSQTGAGDAWVFSAPSSAKIDTGTKTSQILYQAISDFLKKPVFFNYNYFWTGGGTRSGTLSIVFLSGTTVISSEIVAVDDAPSVISGFISLTPPTGCDGIGIKIVKGSGTAAFNLSYYNAGGFITGVKPAGQERVIGRYENKEFNFLYYCVWNENDDHCIRYFDPLTDIEYELLRWSDLFFTETAFVSMEMIDNYLGFTDKINSPRLIDVNTIAHLYNRLTTNFREYHISFHKWAPVMPPYLKIRYDGITNNYKKFINKTFQFAYRYIYKGRLKSRWSPISNSAQHFGSNSGNEITQIQVNIPGFSLDNPGAITQYNYFNNDSIKFTEAVEFIEIAYRESSLDLWRMFHRSTVDATNTSFVFNGDVNGTPIATDDFYQLFDVVPLRCGTIGAIDNRFFFADIEDEKEAAVTPNVTGVGVVKYEATSTLIHYWNAGSNNPSDNATFFSGMLAADADNLGKRNAISQQSFKGRGVYKGGIVWLAANGWRSAVYTSEEFTFIIPEETGITDKIYALTFAFASTYKPPSWAVAYQIVRTDCLNIDYFMFGAANKFELLIDDVARIVANTEVSQTLKDRIRQHFENSRIVTGTEYDKYLTTLKNNPFHLSVVSDVRKTSVSISFINASRISIDVYNWYNSSHRTSDPATNSPLNKLFYNYREGDRVRFIGSTVTSPSSAQKVVFDVPILEFTGINIIIEKPVGLLWLPVTGADLMIEVYTPKIPQNESDFLYYENGEWYPVLYPGTDSRDFSKRDWSYPSDNSAITCSTYGDIKVFNKRPFSYGDCNVLLKTFYYDWRSDGSNSVNAYAPSMNPDPNKTFGYWEKNDGRAYPAYTDLPVVKFVGTKVRFGGQIVEQSFVNNINRVREEDQKIYPSEYGRIRALVNTSNAQVESVGAILFAIGEREAFSIYINRTTLEDLSGNTQVALSDRILGSYNTLLGSYGTTNPESISLNDGRVYYWCASKGSWIRYGRDGLTPISQYKMRNWFKEIGNLLINKYDGVDNPRAICDFDSFNEELVTFIDHSSLPETLRGYSTYKGSMFSEDDKRWKSVHSYEPEFFAKLNDQLYSFKGGVLFAHEKTIVYSTFYGTKYDVKIQPVFNEIPKDVKSWQNIALVANDKWSFELESEYRGAKTKQQSTIGISELEMKEDIYYSDLKLDINSPGGRIDGDKMRSKAIKVMATLDPSIDRLSLLQYIEVGDIDSPKNA